MRQHRGARNVPGQPDARAQGEDIQDGEHGAGLRVYTPGVPRKRSVPKGRANIAAESLAGRTYADFCALPGIERACAVETGAVVGRQGRDAQCVLTLFFRLTKLQVFMLLPDKTAASAVAAPDSLEAVCGESFGALLGTVLCDRGCEFADVAGIEGATSTRTRGSRSRGRPRSTSRSAPAPGSSPGWESRGSRPRRRA